MDNSASPATENVSSNPQVSRSSRPAGKILLVDDDSLVAEACVKLLEDFGYSATRVALANGALAVLADGRKPDLVFSDVVMPGRLNGVELAQTLRDRYPTMPILLTTGFSTAAAVASGFRLLPKSYLPNDLEREIKSALDRGHRT